MHDEQVPDDGDDQLGAPVAAAEKRVLFLSVIIILLFDYYAYTRYIRRDR